VLTLGFMGRVIARALFEGKKNAGSAGVGM